jgi:protein TonB
VVRSRFEEKPEKTALPGEGDKNAKGDGQPDFSPAAPRELSRKPEVTRQVVIPYPDEARRKGIEGTVILRVEVRKDGTVRSVRVLKDPGSGLGEAARKAMTRFRFSPARNKRGRPVDYRLVYKYTFVLD